MKNINKIGVQIELPEAIFQEVAKVATSIEECIKLAQEMFHILPLEWQNAIWERMGDGTHNDQGHFAEIFAKEYNIWDRESQIYYTVNSNYQKKVIELYNNIKLFPMLADYEMPDGDVDPILLEVELSTPFRPVEFTDEAKRQLLN